jgi:hypothetical protein
MQRSRFHDTALAPYDLATGEQPFKGDTSISVLSAILRDTPKSVTELRADLPKELARIIRRCLQEDPEARHQTAEDLRNQLRALKADLDSGETTAVPGGRGGGAALPNATQVLTNDLSRPAALLLVLQALVVSVWWGALVVVVRSIWPAVVLHFASNAVVAVQGLVTSVAGPGLLAYRRNLWLSIPLGLVGIGLLARVVRRPLRDFVASQSSSRVSSSSARIMRFRSWSKLLIHHTTSSPRRARHWIQATLRARSRKT